MHLHPSGAAWRKGGESLRNRNFLQRIRIDGWLVLSNYQKKNR